MALADARLLSMDSLEGQALVDLSKFGHICPLDGGPPMVPDGWRRKRGARRSWQESTGRAVPPQRPPITASQAAPQHVSERVVAAPFTSPPIPGAFGPGGPGDRRISLPSRLPTLGAAGALGSPRLGGAPDSLGRRMEDEAGERVQAPIPTHPSTGDSPASGPADRCLSSPADLPTGEVAAGSGSTRLEGVKDPAIGDHAAPMAGAVAAEAALLAERLRSHSATSPRPSSPPCQTGGAGAGPWDWLTPAGLGAVEHAELKVPRSSVPHLVGRGGRTIEIIENLFGIIVGVGDRGDGEARVTMWGPQDRLDGGKHVVDCVVQGGRSLLRRLSLARMDFQY